MKSFIHVDRLTFTYENCLEPLFREITFHADTGWTAIVGANGSGKTTLLKLLCGLQKPDSGTISLPGPAFYAEQRTDFQPTGLDDLISSSDQSAYGIKNSLQILDQWQDKWDVLSHGERKRCQIAVALNAQPAVLAIDEPSNHLDYRYKQVLTNALRTFPGVGLIVSHDRELMDTLCQRTIFLHPPDIDVRKCSYSTAAMEMARENQSRIEQHELARREVKKLQKQVFQQRKKVDSSNKLLSKRNLDPKDHDARAKIDGARLTGKDAIAGRAYKRMQTRLNRAEEHKNAIQFRKQTALGITFNAEQARKIFPVIIPAAELGLGKEKKLTCPELILHYGDKIGIIGNNGSGKSTFINRFVQDFGLRNERIIYIAQEIPVDLCNAILTRIRNYDHAHKGHIMSIICRLGSDADQLLATELPSPGEARKLLLAEGIMSNPSLIIMDEPTNHMDLPSIECIEQALIECPCAQILVSHDMTFLKKTVNSYWSFRQISNGEYLCRPQLDAITPDYQ
jgi:macrolide transport system ATP-binding/permease protein